MGDRRRRGEEKDLDVDGTRPAPTPEAAGGDPPEPRSHQRRPATRLMAAPAT
jgi:hypothetical protein